MVVTAKLIFTNDILSQLTRRAVRWGIVLGLVCGFVAGLPIYLIGALCGLPFGLVVGIIAALLAAWLLYLVTTVFYLPISPSKFRQYRLVSALICVFSSLVVACVFQVVFVIGMTDGTTYRIVFIFVPAILAALWSSQRLATWYIDYSS